MTITSDMVQWACRFHPTDWFHEVGCPHCEWTKEQLQEALIAAKWRPAGADSFEVRNVVNDEMITTTTT